MSEDRKAIACNYAGPVSVAARGALAYVRWANYGSGNDRIPLLIRSRGGRWIEKWEAMHRLVHFRIKTIPPEHPLYDRIGYEYSPDEMLRYLHEACLREHAIRTGQSSD